ncbi:nuclear transport factor 2 family protein [uncultured Sphingomonas sp.]|uniref:nuclear transport factor 2 family protein n=1 Tax=uncultured Sphingomonas sp. TaxID=158754 RepID=UPI00260BA8C1|nr:nuclear transport factor 2 family protein [uncultured Sphingomonas sp.]
MAESPLSLRNAGRSALIAAAMVAVTGAPAATAQTAAERKLAALETRVERLEDRAAIENLTRAYGYYVDKQIWNEIADLFSDNARVEIAGRGVYRGKEGVRRLFLQSMGGGQIGLRPGGLFNHMILQGVTDIAPDGKTAKGRWRAFVQIGQHKMFGIWSEGTYENQYVKENGVWKFSDMHFYATFYAPYEQGWAQGARPNNGPSKDAPPDEPQSVQYDVYPGHYVPPFHYPNPVTGKPWTIEESRKYSTTGMSPAPAGPPIQPGSAMPPAPAPKPVQ